MSRASLERGEKIMSNWNGMKVLTWDEVKELGRKGEFPSNKYYFLYDDGTEAMMDTDTSWVDIIEHYEENGGDVGGRFGVERDDVKTFKTPEGLEVRSAKTIIFDDNIDNDLDLENVQLDLWEVILQYMDVVGISKQFEDHTGYLEKNIESNPGVDYTMVKCIENAIFLEFEKMGMKFESDLDDKICFLNQVKSDIAEYEDWKDVKADRLKVIADNLVDYISDKLDYGVDETERILRDEIGMSDREIKLFGWNISRD